MAAATRPRRSRANWLAPTLVVVVLLAAWELIVRAGAVDPLLLPAPTSVVKSLWTDRSLLFDGLLLSASRRTGTNQGRSGSAPTHERSEYEAGSNARSHQAEMSP